MLNHKLTNNSQQTKINELLIEKNIFFEKFKKTDDIMLEHFSDRVNIKNFENTINLLYNIDNARDNDDVFQNTKLLDNNASTTTTTRDNDDTILTQTGSKSYANEKYDNTISYITPVVVAVDDKVKGQRYIENRVKQCHGNIFDKQTTATTYKNNIHSVCCCYNTSDGNGKCNQFIAGGYVGSYRNSNGCDCISITMVKGNKLNSIENCENSGNFDKELNENVKYVGDDDDEEGDDADKKNIKLEMEKLGMCLVFLLYIIYSVCVVCSV